MVCSISNPDFVIYSSVVSFYLPFIITLLVYVRIYVFLRMRRKRVAFGQTSGKVQPGLAPSSMVSQSFYVCVPFSPFGVFKPNNLTKQPQKNANKQNILSHICFNIQK